MFKLRIKELLLSKGHDNPFAWLRSQGIPHNSAHKLLADKYHRIPMYHIATICRAAWCTPNDLFEWTTTSKKKERMKGDTSPLQEGHPLRKLIARQPVNLRDITQRLTESDLKELETRAEEILKRKNS